MSTDNAAMSAVPKSRQMPPPEVILQRAEHVREIVFQVQTITRHTLGDLSDASSEQEMSRAICEAIYALGAMETLLVGAATELEPDIIDAPVTSAEAVQP